MEWVISTFPHHTQFIDFFLDYFFSILSDWWFSCSNSFYRIFHQFFTVEIINDICPWYNIFRFPDQKTSKDFLGPNWRVALFKNIFLFSYSQMISNFKFRIFVIIFNTIVNKLAPLIISWFHFSCYMICVVVCVNYFI